MTIKQQRVLEKEALAEPSPNDVALAKIAAVTDPVEALRTLHENWDFLGYDPYYADFYLALQAMVTRCVQTAIMTTEKDEMAALGFELVRSAYRRDGISVRIGNGKARPWYAKINNVPLCAHGDMLNSGRLLRFGTAKAAALAAMERLQYRGKA